MDKARGRYHPDRVIYGHPLREWTMKKMTIQLDLWEVDWPIDACRPAVVMLFVNHCERNPDIEVGGYEDDSDVSEEDEDDTYYSARSEVSEAEQSAIIESINEAQRSARQRFIDEARRNRTPNENEQNPSEHRNGENPVSSSHLRPACGYREDNIFALNNRLRQASSSSNPSSQASYPNNHFTQVSGPRSPFNRDTSPSSPSSQVSRANNPYTLVTTPSNPFTQSFRPSDPFAPVPGPSNSLTQASIPNQPFSRLTSASDPRTTPANLVNRTTNGTAGPPLIQTRNAPTYFPNTTFRETSEASARRRSPHSTPEELRTIVPNEIQRTQPWTWLEPVFQSAMHAAEHSLEQPLERLPSALQVAAGSIGLADGMETSPQGAQGGEHGESGNSAVSEPPASN